jgi:hypothetical protein
MAGSRTLKLSILADVDDLKKKLNDGEKEVTGFAGQVEKFGAAAKAAFAAAAAAAAAYAVKLAVDGVKAAIEDEAAQKRLENALKNVTTATDAQIAAVEQQILQTSLATGVADDKLRPALQRLAIATGDVAKSQDLLKLALDISAATGRDVETVANALGKAYEGNTASLVRLGVGLSATEIKTLGLEGAISTLSTTFGGSAATQAETFQGKIARVQVAFDEAKETLGTFLLPLLEKFLTFITTTAIPALKSFKESAIDPVVAAFRNNREAIKGVYDFAKDILVPFLSYTLVNSLKGLSTVASVIVNAVSIAIKALEPIINAAISGINAIIRAKNLLTSGPDTPTLSKLTFGSTANTGSNTITGGGAPFGVNIGSTTGGNIIGGSTGAGTGSGAGVGVATGTGTGSGSGAPVITIPSVLTPSNQPIPSNFDVGGFRAAEERGNVIVNVNAPSVIDEEGFTRAVVLALNNSTNRGTTGGGDLRTNAQIL